MLDYYFRVFVDNKLKVFFSEKSISFTNLIIKNSSFFGILND